VVTVDSAARLGALSGGSGTGLACGELISPRICVFGLYSGGRIQSALGQFWVDRPPPRLEAFWPLPPLPVGGPRYAVAGGESIPLRDMVCGECGKLSDGALNAHPPETPRRAAFRANSIHQDTNRSQIDPQSDAPRARSRGESVSEQRPAQ
jgi:hypothetical protein